MSAKASGISNTPSLHEDSRSGNKSFSLSMAAWSQSSEEDMTPGLSGLLLSTRSSSSFAYNVPPDTLMFNVPRRRLSRRPASPPARAPLVSARPLLLFAWMRQSLMLSPCLSSRTSRCLAVWILPLSTLWCRCPVLFHEFL
jgi:hypothetical protein